MSCDKTAKTCSREYVEEGCRNNIDYLIVIVLYILLVIILSACLFR